MDQLIELVASGNKIPQMPTGPTIINSYAIGSPIRDIQIIIRCKNRSSNVQKTVRHKLCRWNEGSRRKIHFFGVEVVGKWHRRPWFPFATIRTMISGDETRILT